MRPGGSSLWSRLSAPNTPRGSRRGWPASGEPAPSPGTGAREYSDRELIATSPSRGAPFEGGSDAATRWNPAGEGFASVPGPPHGSLARPVDGRASRDSGCARFVLTALRLAPSVTTPARAATSCPADGCAVTVDARDFASGNPLANFNYIVNKDNTKLPSDPLALSSESNSPIVAEGDQDRPHRHTCPTGRYLISVRSLDHKMWGTYITLPDDAAADGSLTAQVDLTEQSADHPLPLGKLRIFVFEDNAWTNGAPDTEEATAPGAQRLPGRAGGADRQRGHRRLQQQPALRRHLPDREPTASSRSTISVRPPTSSTCTRRTTATPTPTRPTG